MRRAAATGARPLRGPAAAVPGLRRRARSPPAEPSTAQRLQELETLRATGAVSDEEYAAKRPQIISEL